MRWKNHYQRVVKRFAIFPVKARVEGGMDFEYRWLETVYRLQHRDWLFGIFPIWETDTFVNEHYYELYLKNRRKTK